MTPHQAPERPCIASCSGPPHAPPATTQYSTAPCLTHLSPRCYSFMLSLRHRVEAVLNDGRRWADAAPGESWAVCPEEKREESMAGWRLSLCSGFCVVFTSRWSLLPVPDASLLFRNFRKSWRFSARFKRTFILYLFQHLLHTAYAQRWSCECGKVKGNEQEAESRGTEPCAADTPATDHTALGRTQRRPPQSRVRQGALTHVLNLCF